MLCSIPSHGIGYYTENAFIASALSLEVLNIYFLSKCFMKNQQDIQFVWNGPVHTFRTEGNVHPNHAFVVKHSTIYSWSWNSKHMAHCLHVSNLGDILCWPETSIASEHTGNYGIAHSHNVVDNPCDYSILLLIQQEIHTFNCPFNNMFGKTALEITPSLIALSMNLW